MIEWKPSKQHFQFVTDSDFFHDKKTNVDYFLEVENGTLYCFFQSTRDGKDWQSDFDFFPRKFDVYPGSRVFAHGGIAKQYFGMRSRFLDLVYRDDVERVYIAGFSLGGGLAQLACEDAAWHLTHAWIGAPKEVKSISYEGPRVFFKNRDVEKTVKGKQVLVKTWWDPVVHLPLKVLGFRDYGSVEWIGKWNKALPLQHFPGQVEANLFEKFGH